MGTCDRTVRLFEGGRRGVAPIVGVILLFGLVFAGATVVFVFGSELQSQLQQGAERERATSTLQNADADLSTLFLDGYGSVAQLDFGDDPDAYNVTGDGTIEFVVNGNDDCKASDELGAIVYEDDGAQIAYQAGGIWRAEGASSAMVSAPTLRYSEDRVDGDVVRMIDFDYVTVDGERVGSRTTARTTPPSSDIGEALCLSGPNADEIDRVHEITITVSNTEYGDGWEQFFESEFGHVGTIGRSSTAVSVTAPLGGERTVAHEASIDPVIHSGIYSTFSDEVTVTNDEIVVRNVDGDPEQLIADGDLQLQPQTVIDGHVAVSGKLSSPMAGSGNCAEVTGIATYGDSSGIDNCDDIVGTRTDDFVDEQPEPIDDSLVATHDFAVAEGTPLPASGPIENGTYYASDLDLSGETIDTSNGDVFVAAGDVTLADVDVTGDNRLVVYAGPDRSTIDVDGDVEIVDGGSVSVYGPSETDVLITGKQNDHVTFEGLIYAPSASGDGSIEVGHAEVVGALTGGHLTVDGDATFTFDRGLRTALPQEVSVGESADGEVTGPGGAGVVGYDARATVLGSELSHTKSEGGGWFGDATHYSDNWPITAELRIDDDGGTDTFRPFPRDRDPEAPFQGDYADDLNHPGTVAQFTHEFENLSPDSSFSVYATSFVCESSSADVGGSDPWRETGVVETIDGTDYHQRTCDNDALDVERLSVNTDADENQYNLVVYEDGDEVAGVEGAMEDQASMRDMLEDRLDEDGRMDLDPGEFVFAFELYEDGLDEDDFEDGLDCEDGTCLPDYNDMVLLYEITDVHVAGEYDVGGSIVDTVEDNGYVLNVRQNSVVLETAS